MTIYATRVESHVICFVFHIGHVVFERDQSPTVLRVKNTCSTRVTYHNAPAQVGRPCYTSMTCSIIACQRFSAAEKRFTTSKQN